jgi:hypothetical protein
VSGPARPAASLARRGAVDKLGDQGGLPLWTMGLPDVIPTGV